MLISESRSLPGVGEVDIPDLVLRGLCFIENVRKVLVFGVSQNHTVAACSIAMETCIKSSDTITTHFEAIPIDMVKNLEQFSCKARIAIINHTK